MKVAWKPELWSLSLEELKDSRKVYDSRHLFIEEVLASYIGQSTTDSLAHARLVAITIWERGEFDEGPKDGKGNIKGQDIAKQITDAFLAESKINGVYEHKNTIYVRFLEPETERLRLLEPTSREFKRYLSRLHYRVRNKTLTNRMMDKILLYLDSLIAEQVFLTRRIAFREGFFYFDLSSDKGEVVKIEENGWKIEVPEKPMFISSDQQTKSFIPTNHEDKREAFNELWKHINHDKTFLLLHKVTFLFSFMAVFPQPISVVHGEHGSAKSYFTKVWQRFVDPSLGDNHQLTKEIKQLAHVLGSNWFVSFDNVSGIKQDQSDLLCQASTGGTVSQRKLYTDGETFNLNLRSVVVLNGINVSPNQPDLMRRCILFNFSHIDTKKRRTENDLEDTINAIGPTVLGSIFSLISDSMRLVEKYKNIKEKPIMADFDMWGRALSEALGEDPDDFVKEYKQNRTLQSHRITENDDFGTIMFEYLEGLEYVDGLAIVAKDDLLTEIEREVEIKQPSLKFDKYFPKTTIAITRKLERLRPTLRELGYEYTEERRQVLGQRVRSFVFSVPKCPTLESFPTQKPLNEEEKKGK